MSVNLLGIIVIAAYISLSSSINNLRRTQIEINKKLDMLLDERNLSFIPKVEISDELRSELEALVDENKKVKAVKLLREETGMELVDAKNYIDSI